MKYTLTPYQEDATADVLRRLRQATRDFREDHDYASVSLSAPTGAGKTVIAAAVIERLMFGDDTVEADPLATVLWITDNPSLNEQTRRKMLMASSQLKPAHLITVDAAFDQEMFSPRRVYFLNIQKLGKGTTFVQSGTDSRRWSLWATIGNSIVVNGGHLYVVIDEAHRGTGVADKSRPTIVRRIISDPDGEVPPAPIVWGISATPEKFKEAMAVAKLPSRTQRDVEVPVDEVRASGLLKDTLDVRYPEETQPSTATLTRLAVQNVRMMDERWSAYTAAQDEPPVAPALVVQVPAQETEANLVEILGTIRNSWAGLPDAAVAHSFESHTAMSVGTHTVRYVAPEDIQDDTDVRVVLFKEALTTGWDCPRAETMLSFRTAGDYTYIAQLIGRMVRTPLAQRITTDEVLNRVSLFLPRYDKDSVKVVIDRLQSDPTAPPIEVVRNALALPRNPRVPREAIDVVAAVPTYTVPGRAHKSQVARLHALAVRLAGDGVLENAVRTADAHLIATIERERERLAQNGTYDALVQGLGRIEIGRLSVSFTEGTQEHAEEYARTDARDINTVFRSARRGLRDGLANTYWGWLLDNTEDAELLPDDAKLIVAAVASDATVVEAVENAAAQLVRRWLSDHSRSIADLPAAARAAYHAVRALAKHSEPAELILPDTVNATAEEDAPRWPKHVYAEENGEFPIKVSSWERRVLDIETSRADCVAWYRNPTGGPRAVRVPYERGDVESPFYPDFVFVHDTPDGLRPSIVDPHNYALGDTAAKWRGLSRYAETHSDTLHRVDAVIQDQEGTLLRLDLTDASVRAAVTAATTSDAILQVFKDHGGLYA